MWYTQMEKLPPQVTSLTNLRRIYIQDGSGVITVKSAPRGITNLPCWTNLHDTYGGLSIAEALGGLHLYDLVSCVKI